ncbi:MAG TPA: hypothetical protein VMI56_01295 [Reyranella sp.]|nr:hypothetical protein [Reyranella sp.]
MADRNPEDGSSAGRPIDYLRRLAGLTLHWQRYTRYSESWDHDHCASCGATFAEFDGQDILHEGYATGPDYFKGARYEWVCSPCFDELASRLNWKAA